MLAFILRWLAMNKLMSMLFSVINFMQKINSLILLMILPSIAYAAIVAFLFFFEQSAADIPSLRWVLMAQMLVTSVIWVPVSFNNALSKPTALLISALNGLTIIVIFVLIYQQTGIVFTGPAEYAPPQPYNLREYIYFSTVTFTTLGYGDFQPLPTARIFAAVQSIIGYIYLGIFVGIAVSHRD